MASFFVVKKKGAIKTMENLKKEETKKTVEIETVEIKDAELERLESEGEKASTYATGAEKLKAEENAVLESVVPEYKDIMAQQFGVLFDVLVKKADEDAAFNALVLQEHKSFKRAMKFAENKARTLRTPTEEEKKDARRGIPIVTPVSPEKVLEWIIDYYKVDDKEEYEKEMKKYAPHKPIAVPKTQPTAKAQPSVPHKRALKKGEIEGQIDFMSMFNL